MAKAASLRQQVWNRAGGCCEYCRMPQAGDVQPFQLDHVRPRKHRGPSTFANLALSCLPCNVAKGPNAAAFDPVSDELVRIHDPRLDDWTEHFAWKGPRLMGKTAIGRATIALLRINDQTRIEHRRLLIAAKLFLT